MSETTDKIKYLGMKGTKALLEGLKGEYSPLGHEHSDLIEAINKITDGTTTVLKAEEADHSSTADTATEATHATTADEATKATQDGNGNVIADTYALKDHTHNWNEFGELPENILVYEEQSLTEEQKMQARKNLGLYYKAARHIRLLDSMEIATHTEKELPSDILLNDDITVCITQEDTVSVEYTLEQKEEYDYGSDIIFRWYGNGALVNSSLSDTEEGMVIYRENEGSWRMYIDYSKIESANRYSNFYVDIIDANNTETVYEPIPEEFIPESIARTSDILTQANINSITKSYSPAVDTDLATKAYVDSIIPTQEEALALVAELGFVEPVANNGYVLTDGDNVVYTI